MSDECPRPPYTSGNGEVSLRLDLERHHVRLTLRAHGVPHASIAILPQEARELALTLLDAAKAVEDSTELIVIKGGRR